MAQYAEPGRARGDVIWDTNESPPPPVLSGCGVIHVKRPVLDPPKTLKRHHLEVLIQNLVVELQRVGPAVKSPDGFLVLLTVRVPLAQDAKELTIRNINGVRLSFCPVTFLQLLAEVDLTQVKSV